MQQLLNSLSFIIQSSLESSPVLCSIFVVLISFLWWTWPYKLDSKLPGPPSCTTDPFNSNLLPSSSLPFILKNHLTPTSSHRNFNLDPYVGAMFTVLHNYWRLPDWIAEGTGKYGGGSWGGQMPGIGLLRGAMISVTTPENVKYILKDNFSNYEKGAAVRAGLFELLGFFCSNRQSRWQILGCPSQRWAWKAKQATCYSFNLDFCQPSSLK